jgi:hypothetical protein
MASIWIYQPSRINRVFHILGEVHYSGKKKKEKITIEEPST